jgi:hypothetical protein
MKKHRTAPPVTAVIPFPVPPSGSANNDDPRWRRVEALYREVAVLSPEPFERDLRQTLERVFTRAFPARRGP